MLYKVNNIHILRICQNVEGIDPRNHRVHEKTRAIGTMNDAKKTHPMTFMKVTEPHAQDKRLGAFFPLPSQWASIGLRRITYGISTSVLRSQSAQNLLLVSKGLGCASINITSDVYVRLLPGW